ncbi:MAG: TldD/PmbA family protein [Desulfobacterota bacterium]|nr:TldD/PmbA family protein [Thermodesulfobacteriota bacterium]
MLSPDLPFEKILKESLRHGGDFADLYYEQTYSVAIICEEDRIEKMISGHDVGVGLRVLFDQRTFYGFTNRLQEEDLLHLARVVHRAIQEDRAGGLYPLLHPAGPSLSAPSFPPSVSTVQKDPRSVVVEEKVAMVNRANALARRLDPRVKQVRVLYRDVSQRISIANSEGSWIEGERIGTVFSVQVVASQDGLLQTGYEPVGGTKGFELFDEIPPETVAEVAARRALRMLSARKAPMGKMTVVLSSEAGGTMIHEAVGHGLEADLAQQGLSVYSGKLGEKIASSLITVVDDPTLPHRRGSYAFDDEGVLSRRTVLVEEGVLKNYLYDRLSALRDGKTSTGNGRRESYQAKPIPRMSNTLILPGKTKPEAIIRSVERGLFVKKMGGGQVNTVNGDFVFEVSEGYLIEKGSLGEPVRGAILIGNGPQILKEIDMVGDDLGFGIGTCGKDGQGVPVADGQPTLRIPEIVVGGREEPASRER